MTEVGDVPVRGKALRFHCRLISPFHTTRQEYASLWKCAPFISGSTLRGALLSHLITTTYPPEALAELAALSDPAAVKTFHQQFEGAAPVRPFFADPPGAWVSFGLFRGEAERELRGLTRIALEREHASVAAGAIVNVELIGPGSEEEPTRFDFEILLPGDDGTLAGQLERATWQIAEVGSLGGLRSIGLGRFAVEEVERLDLWERVTERENELQLSNGPKVTLEFTTPYVLAEGLPDTQRLSARLGEQWQAALNRAGYRSDDEPIVIRHIEAQLRPEFVGRWHYEQGTRDNRLAAWAGSRVVVELERLPFDWRDQLTMASLFGLGEWSEVGFGRFRPLVT